ncbi:DNA helicase [Tanacetum coccineum]
MGESSNEAAPSREMVDEIQNYVEGRFILHLQDMQQITFRDRDRLRSVVDLPGKKNTTLNEWFSYNASNEMGRHLSYLEFPSEFVWHSDSKSWSPRRNSKTACEALGLLGDDKEWETALEKSYESRYTKESVKKVQIPNYHLNADSLQGYALNELEIILNNYAIYDLIINADENSRHELIFVYGHGRTGIASFLLPSGHTAHSRFKLPFELTKESLYIITKNTQLGNLLADTDLIIWDEAPMNDRCCFEALDKSLRDIINILSSLFGEKMRLTRPDITLEERSLVNLFGSWLLDIGDEKIGCPAKEDLENTSWINIPAIYCLTPDEQGLSKLVNLIYDQST